MMMTRHLIKYISNKRQQINLSKNTFPMRSSVQKPMYELAIYTKPFRSKSLPIQERIKSDYLPKYWRKLKMDQKIIKPNEQDRLSKLTTKQIDRIIDMEKIKYALKNKKNGNEQLYLEKYKPEENKHPNVYRANFLSRVNKIAIQRRIFTEQAEGFEQVYGEYNPESIRRRQLQKQKENIKYIKVYSSQKRDKNKLSLNQMQAKNKFFIDDEKSVDSISDDNYMETAEKKIQQRHTMTNMFKRSKSYKEDGKLLCSRKWFDGMSTFYLGNQNFFGSNSTHSEERGIDLQNIIERNKTMKGHMNKMFFCNRVKTESEELSTIRSNTNNTNQLMISSLENLF